MAVSAGRELDEQALEGFKAGLRGRLIRLGEPGYEAARAVYNAMIDKYPALIVQAADVADVMAAVNFAREQGLLLAVRGGGHNGGGLGTCDDGLVIDLHGMRGIRVDAQARRVRVEGGATLGEVDHATHAFGLAVPAGIISTTGVGGLTLGGGLGHLTRKYGLTIDHLLEVDVVLANGQLVTASERQHPELFWAVRGGGGNFGVVTSFLFQANPVHTVVAGPTFYDLEQTPEVLAWYGEFLPQAPEELNGFFAVMTVPPAPLFPQELHLRKVAAVMWCYCGPLEKAEEVLAPVRAFGSPLLYGVGAMPYPALQSLFDGLYPPGHQWYWRADFVGEVPPAAAQQHLEHARKLPTPQSTMHLYPVDGAAHRIGSGDTAWSYRDARWAQVIVGVDPDPAKAQMIKDWCVGYWEALHPYSLGGAYVNFMMDEGQERVRATYRGNYERLAQVKRMYDPDNLFRVNQNIRPA